MTDARDPLIPLSKVRDMIEDRPPPVTSIYRTGYALGVIETDPETGLKAVRLSVARRMADTFDMTGYLAGRRRDSPSAA